ncbi:MAG: methyl-accepting chemotaxis protein, partial [Magnetococcales bacterium]|nr:methyl-accepting chemotaxis protein [Magnetococcales bacterium]
RGKENKNWLQKFSDAAGYYDLFLIHPTGTVFYTAARQADFATNLLTGPFAGTNLGQLFKRVVKTGQFGMSDLVPYPPSDNQPAYFMAQPVLENGQTILIMALQLPPDAISGIMHQVANSESLQTFLVGPDQRLRSDAFTNAAQPAAATAFVGGAAASVMATSSVESALAGETNTRTTTRSDGKPVLSSFAPIPLDHFNWAVVAEIELAPPDLHTPSRWQLWAMLLCVTLLALAGSRILQHDLVYPLLDASASLNRMASGRFETVPGRSRGDELGILTRSATTVASELAQAGQRVHQAAEPLSARLRRLASFAMAISREATAGSETLRAARADIEESARLHNEESARMAEEYARLVAAQAGMVSNAEKMATLTAQAVAAGKQEFTATLEAWRQIHGRIQLLRQSAQEIMQMAQRHPTDDPLRTGKHGKKEWLAMVAQLTQTWQNELNDLEAAIGERLQTSDRMESLLDNMVPTPPPPVRQAGTNRALAREHTPERTLLALDKADGLLRQNVTAAREILMGAKSLFDLTTGPLRQATSFFTQHAHPEQESLANPEPHPVPLQLDREPDQIPSETGSSTHV